jgi:hypothetical protein
MNAATDNKAGLNAAVPLLHAVFCVDCETISNSPHDACTICGSHSLISLLRTLGGTLRGQKAPSTKDHAKYSLQLTARVHEIPATDLNLLLELLARLAEVGGTVESLHLSVEPVTYAQGVLRAA